VPNYNICKTCGTIFETERGYRDFCDSCRVPYKKPEVLPKPQLKYKPRKCKFCGAVIKQPKKAQRVCDECRTPAKRKSNAERFRAIQQRVAEAQRKAQPQKPALTIEEVNRMALSMGLTYGQFMAKYGG